MQKFGELIQKKLEVFRLIDQRFYSPSTQERKTETNPTEDCPTTAETGLKEQQQINCEGKEPQIDEPEEEREKEKEEEQEKESEREKEPEHCEVKVSIAGLLP